MYSITTRSPTSAEQRLIEARSKSDAASIGCIVIFFGVVPALLLGQLGKWLGGFIAPHVAIYGQWIGWSVAAIIFLTFLWKFSRLERRRRQRASQDRDERIIQEIHVRDPRVIEIGLINDNEPILAFEIGDNKILFMQGQWLRDEAIYGADPLEDDPRDDIFNGLPEPHSFPSTEFTISRFPNSGEVVGIHVSGSYLAPPAQLTEALQPEYEFADAELLDGSLDDIAGVLSREHTRRQSS